MWTVKVEAKEVVSFIDKVKAMVEDITHTLRSGDDGFEQVILEQVESVAKVIDVFKLQQLTELTPVTSTEKKYSKIYDQYAEKTDKTWQEAKDLYRAELYYLFKRLIAADGKISEVANKELMPYVECLLPDSSNYKKMFYSNEFMYTSLEVLDEVVNEIIDQRAKAPQTKLF